MRDTRPKNLNLFTIRQPIPAIVSILHRISGILLFLSIPVILWALDLSLSSQQGYDSIHQMFLTPGSKFIVWILLSAFIYHFVAGIRHLLMDIDIGVELKSGTVSAILTLLITIPLIAIIGIWLW